MIKIDEQLKNLIKNNAVALATVGKDGKPHCIAVAYLKVISDDKILITDNYMVETRDNIKYGSDISLVVWNKEWQNNCIGYELRGKAEYFKDDKWHKELKKIPENKGEPCKGAILATIYRIKKLV